MPVLPALSVDLQAVIYNLAQSFFLGFLVGMSWRYIRQLLEKVLS